jgi:hypothetical protein
MWGRDDPGFFGASLPLKSWYLQGFVHRCEEVVVDPRDEWAGGPSSDAQPPIHPGHCRSELRMRISF